MITRLAVAGLLAAGLGALPAHAQVGAAMEVGAGSAFARADLSYLTPPAGPLRLELGGGVLQRSAARSWESGARLHLHGARRGAWMGIAYGGAAAPGSIVPVRALGAGGWMRVGAVDLHVSVARGVYGDSISQPGQPTVRRDPELTATDTLVQQRIRAFTDVSAAAAWQRGRLELGAGASHRVVVGGATSRRNRYHTAWRLDGAFHLTPRLAIAAATGQYAEQLATVLPGGRYTTLSLRVALTRRRPARLAIAPPIELGDWQPFSAVRRDDGLVRIRIEAPGATSVELAGDFTDWEPVRLARTYGHVWEVVLPVEKGLRQANVRIDGGSWQLPPATTPMGDDFGGTVGVFRVD